MGDDDACNGIEVLTSENVLQMKKEVLEMTKAEYVKLVVGINQRLFKLQNVLPYLSQGRYRSKKEITTFIRTMMLKNFSLLKDPSYIISDRVREKSKLSPIERHPSEFGQPYDVECVDVEFIEKFWVKKTQKMNKIFQEDNYLKMYKNMSKHISKGRYYFNVIENENGNAAEEFSKYYGEFAFNDENLKIDLLKNSYIPEAILRDNLSKGIQALKTGQVLSRDLLPDDCFSKKELFEVAVKDMKGIFFGFNEVAYKVKALILSKTQSRIEHPNNCKLIILQPLLMRIVDQTVLHFIKE